MNTAALKTFAPAVRRQLMEAVTRKLDLVLSAQTPDYLTTFAPQVAALRKLAQADRAGLIERVAYTWFNRFAALRFMDAHGWHPFGARVLTPASATETQPELLKVTRTAALPQELRRHTDPVRLNDLLDGRIPSSDAQGEVYRHLVLAACHFYHALLPDTFEKLNDETELLLPDDLLTEHSVVHGFRTDISDDDCVETDANGKPRANVEILGWLYQFYISEKKDAVMARKSAVPTADIPAVTQLFTPHWIVRYLVENSLGRLWLDSRPNSKLREHMPYFVESGKWGVESEEKKVESEDETCQHPTDENTKLQGPDCLAEGDGPGGGNTPSEQNVSTRRALRPDQPDPAGGGISPVEHRGGASTQLHGAVSQLSVDQPRLPGGSGNPASPGTPLPISETSPSLPGFGLAGGGETPSARTGKQLEVRGSGKLEVGSEKQEAKIVGSGKWEVKSKKLRPKALPTLHFPLSTFHSPLRVEKPQDIKLCDPAAGSGHMLTYAFDLLYLIYEEEGYAPSEIPALILQHNLHGLEICPRAAQLAELALVFKAREKSRRFFQPEHFVRPNIIELQDVRFDDGELSAYFKALGSQPSARHPQLATLLQQFEESKNFGSLIQPCLTEAEIQSVRSAIQNPTSNIQNSDLMVGATHLKVLRVLDQAEGLTQRYHVVVANPPYMGNRGMNAQLREFMSSHYEPFKADLFAAFVFRGSSLAVKSGHLGFMTPNVWMFISSHEDLRKHLLNHQTLTTLAELPLSGFTGATVQICAFAFRNHHIANFKGGFIRLLDFKGPAAMEIRAAEAIANTNCGWFYRASSDDFKKITGSPIAYGVGEGIFKMLETADRLGSIAEPRMGLATGDNSKYVRLWHECDKHNIGFSMENRKTAKESGLRWFPYCKGGAYRKWYGNNEYVVDWHDDGNVLQTTMHPSGERIWAHNFNLTSIFKDSITWSDVTSGYLSARFNSAGFMFDGSGTCAFFNSEAEKLTTLGLINTTFTREFAKVLNPTLHFQTGDFRNVPYIAALGTPVFICNVRTLRTTLWPAPASSCAPLLAKPRSRRTSASSRTPWARI